MAAKTEPGDTGEDTASEEVLDTDADTDADADAGVDGEPDGRSGSRRSRSLPNIFLAGATALAVAALAVAAWFGVEWIKAANDDDLTFAQVRDEVSRVAKDAVVTMNTLDYREAEQGLDAWERVTTGPLHDEIVNGRDKSKKAIEQAETVTEATVLSAAVRELEDRAGEAEVIVAIRVSVNAKGTEPSEKYQRIEATLEKTEQGWKLSTIGQVAEGAAPGGSGGQDGSDGSDGQDGSGGAQGGDQSGEPDGEQNQSGN